MKTILLKFCSNEFEKKYIINKTISYFMKIKKIKDLEDKRAYDIAIRHGITAENIYDNYIKAFDEKYDEKSIAALTIINYEHSKRNKIKVISVKAGFSLLGWYIPANIYTTIERQHSKKECEIAANKLNEILKKYQESLS